MSTITTITGLTLFTLSLLRGVQITLSRGGAPIQTYALLAAIEVTGAALVAVGAS